MDKFVSEHSKERVDIARSILQESVEHMDEEITKIDESWVESPESATLKRRFLSRKDKFKAVLAVIEWFQTHDASFDGLSSLISKIGVPEKVAGRYHLDSF